MRKFEFQQKLFCRQLLKNEIVLNESITYGIQIKTAYQRILSRLHTEFRSNAIRFICLPTRRGKYRAKFQSRKTPIISYAPKGTFSNRFLFDINCVTALARKLIEFSFQESYILFFGDCYTPSSFKSRNNQLLKLWVIFCVCQTEDYYESIPVFFRKSSLYGELFVRSSMKDAFYVKPDKLLFESNGMNFSSKSFMLRLL